MKQKILFNPLGCDDNKTLIKGNTTNILDLYNIKYKDIYKLSEKMLGNHWVPESVNMLEDKACFKKLSENEKDAYLKILSFLIFLDSIQTNNIVNIANYITAPEVVFALSRQQHEEAIHSKSYGHILRSIFDVDTANKAMYYWRDEEILLKRNEYVANIYQKFVDNPSDDKQFLRVLVANYILEGVYFYNGFNFFYNLGSRGLMTSTVSQIKYINRDELCHCALFVMIINTLREENPEIFEDMEEEIYEMFRESAEQEIKFSQFAIRDVLGITDESIEKYTKYIVNKRLKALKMKPIYEHTENPYKHLEYMAGVEDEGSNKPANFEVKSTQYSKPNAFKGWDDV